MKNTKKRKTTTKKVYKAKPIRKGIIKRSAYGQKNKKLRKNGKQASMPIRILRKPVTKAAIAATAIGIGAFFIIRANMVPSLESIQSSVVQIEACNDIEYGCGSGSGFAAFRDNYIVTNYHVIDGANNIKIKTIDDVEGRATNVIIFDPVQDIAILEWDHTLTPIGIGSSESTNVGDKVLAIGNPLSESNVVSEGIISSKNSEHGLMTTAAISPGSSGGALILDSNHKVIGVTYLKQVNGESMNYAIRIEDVSKVYNNYQNQNYFLINSNTIDACHTNLDKIALDANNLTFTGCKDSQIDSYSTSNLSAFYEATNKRVRFEHALVARSDWKVLYDRLSSAVKNQIIDHLDSTHSAAFDTNWKYVIWFANENFYYSCTSDYCSFLRYIDGYYPTQYSPSTTGTESDLQEL